MDRIEPDNSTTTLLRTVFARTHRTKTTTAVITITATTQATMTSTAIIYI